MMINRSGTSSVEIIGSASFSKSLLILLSMWAVVGGLTVSVIVPNSEMPLSQAIFQVNIWGWAAIFGLSMLLWLTIQVVVNSILYRGRMLYISDGRLTMISRLWRSEPIGDIVGISKDASKVFEDRPGNLRLKLRDGRSWVIQTLLFKQDVDYIYNLLSTKLAFTG